MVHRHTAARLVLGLLGLACIVLGTVMSQFWHSLLWSSFEKNLAIGPDSPSFQKWKLTPIPLIMSVYFWNWTNPDSIYMADYKPSFVEMGPYVFREVHEKVNVTWNSNGTITYTTIKRWYFDEEQTNGSLSDNVTSVNVVAASMSYMSQDWNRWVLYSLSMALRSAGQEITWTRNVSQLLFEGFDNPIQKLASYVPGQAAKDKFGYFYGMNGTLPDEVVNMDTGANNIHHIGAIREVNYRNTTYDGGGKCSAIEGSANGEFWPPGTTKTKPLRMFAPPMCRQVAYYYEHESTYKGLPTYVYVGSKETVDNGTLIPGNKCYCGRAGLCRPSGLLDISNCSQGAPIFISYPHFFNADPVYRAVLQGMQPDASRHKFFMEIEPRTGTPVNVCARTQINVLLQRHPVLSIFRNVPEKLYLPVMWLENKAALTDELVSGVHLLLGLSSVGPHLWYGVCTMGFVIVCVAIIWHVCQAHPLSRLNMKPGSSKSKKKKTDLHPLQQIHTPDLPNKETVKYVPHQVSPDHSHYHPSHS